MKILVTGGAGFIGSHVVLALLQQGHSVVVLDNMNDYYDPALKYARLGLFANQVIHEHVNLEDTAAVEEVFARHHFDCIVHLGAQAGVRYSLINPHAYAYTNVLGTLNIFESARKHEVSHVVFASTSSVYGLNTKMPFSETDAVASPVSIYAASKLATEHLAHNYHHMYGMNLTALRFFNVYGPWGRPDNATWIFTKAILEDAPITVFNDGNMSRDFTYVDDIVAGIIASIDRPNGYQIFNLGKGEPVPLMDFIRTIEKTLGKTAILKFAPMQKSDVERTYADITKARTLLNYDPSIRVEEGVRRFVEWYKQFHNDTK